MDARDSNRDRVKTGPAMDSNRDRVKIGPAMDSKRDRVKTGPPTDSNRKIGPATASRPLKKRASHPHGAQQPVNVKADVIWALRNSGGGMTVFDISSKITAAGKPRYSETKILHILEMLITDRKVSKGEETGRVTYKWAVEAI